jgi:hypothetical protein
MNVMQNVLTRSIAVRQAHLAWLAAPKGAEKDAAKKTLDAARSAHYQATELYERQLLRSPP